MWKGEVGTTTKRPDTYNSYLYDAEQLILERAIDYSLNRLLQELTDRMIAQIRQYVGEYEGGAQADNWELSIRARMQERRMAILREMPASRRELLLQAMLGTQGDDA